MPRKKVIRKERGVFEKVPGSDIWWIRYSIDGREHREKVGAKATQQTSIESDARTPYAARRCPQT